MKLIKNISSIAIFIIIENAMVYINDLHKGQIMDLLKEEVSSDIRFASLSPDKTKLVIVTTQRYNNIEIYFPELKLCTDNAAMIAITGYYKYHDKDFCSIDKPAYSRVTI